MEILKIGIIGCGNIANKLCNAVKIVSDSAGIVLSACATHNDIEKAKGFAEKHNIPSYYGSYTDMLEKADIDCVYIATTHNFHLENIILCAEYGKHILCEKPLVLHEADAIKATEFCREKGVVLMEAMWSRFLPHIQCAKKWIEEGRIGKICGMVSACGFNGGNNVNGRLLNRSLAGGGVYDMSVYPIELMQYLAGCDIISSFGSYVPHPETGADVSSAITLRFGDFDAMAMTLINANVDEFLTVYGSKGTIKLPHASTGNRCELYSNESDVFECSYENGFTFEVSEFASLIREKKVESSVIPHKDTIMACKVYDTILGK